MFTPKEEHYPLYKVAPYLHCSRMFPVDETPQTIHFPAQLQCSIPSGKVSEWRSQNLKPYRDVAMLVNFAGD